MELRQLRYFLRVAELKSFSRAAASVRIAQPAISRQIRKLEDEIGIPLLYRHGRGVVLTKGGERFFEQVSGILRQLEQAKIQIQAERDEPSGEVVLGFLPQLGAVFLAHVIRKFRGRYPKAQIRVVEGVSDRIDELLQSGRVDLGFVYQPKMYRHLVAEVAVEEDLYLIGPSDDEVTCRSTCSFKNIIDQNLIIPDRPSSLRICVEDAAAKSGLDVQFHLEIDSIPAIKELVREGEGHAVLPYAAVSDEVERKILTASRIVRPTMWRLLGLVSPRSGMQSLASKMLIKLIREEIESLMAQRAWSGRMVGRAP